MIHLNISSAGFLLLVASILCTGCLSGPIAGPGFQVETVPSAEVEEFLAQQGFDAEFSTPAVTDWERQTFNVIEKEQWQAKSRAEVPNWERAYYRYTIVKETYQTPQEARDRGNRIREQPPGLGPEEDKAFPLRAGFSFDKNVYVVSCNVMMFYEQHMKKFTLELEQAVSKPGSPQQ